MNNYFTTAIYYANSRLHAGSVYEAIYTDSLVRYSRMGNNDTFFLTGMDEHGQKIAESAIKNGMEPQKFVDMHAETTRQVFNDFKVNYDYFIRTTDKAHKEYVQNLFQKLLDSGDIYSGSYEGNYCVTCEAFCTASQLNDNKCPECGKPVQKLSEESYFLNLKKYEQRLIKHIEDNPEFIQPEAKRNEIMAFLKNGLEDLSVTRTSFDWGIPTLNDPKHIIYVWIDALSNYISALDTVGNGSFDKYWNNGKVVHVVGKDISRFHAIYWPIMLMALDIKLPDSIVVHGFIMLGKEKMSKSVGNVLYAEEFSKLYGIDSFRYYVLTELSNGNDGSLTYEQFLERYNFDLVNDLSNLVNRTVSMCKKYFETSIKYDSSIECEFFNDLEQTYNDTVDKYHLAMKKYDTKLALQHVWRYISRTNKFIDETTPWVLIKEDQAKLMNVLYILNESIRNISILIQPFISDTAKQVTDQLNVAVANSFDELGYDFTKEYNVNNPEIIFKRLDIKEELEKLNTNNESVKTEEDFISIDDFDKLDLRVAEVVDCVQHPNADKLLLFKLKVGEEERQICSGIAEFYKPEELIGKHVIIIANLKPVKLRGEVSEGMILSAEFGKDLTILETTAASGAKVL